MLRAAPTILQVLPALESGGVERGTVEIAQAVTQAGGVALVASAGGRMVPQLERVGGRHLPLALMTKDPLNIWLNSFALGRVIRRERVDLVHARSRGPAWSAYWAARRASVPFVTTWHGVYDENWPGKRLYNSVMARGDRVIAISRFVADRLRGLDVPEERIRLIPRGVDAALFNPATVTGDRMHKLAQAWRLPAGAPVVMLPGRLTRWKGAELLLRAIAKLPDNDVFCVFVGGGDGLTRPLTRLAERLGLTGRVRLAGQCDDMPAALMLADVVACPSTKPEPFGRTAIEAQALGRLVVAADHGGLAETVVEGTGWRAPPGDVEAWAAAIGAALSLPAETRTEVSVAARAHVMEHYTVGAMQAATLAVYRELLG
ncbi:MAG TPA: glycosyltransferase family 4 protein [Acetobacteraceae bacterium]|nr:glycosyltransferase family 4 protein [Acetobacteraceae bacterium]